MIGRAWRRVAMVFAVVVGTACPVPIFATTAHDLVAEADRLRQSPEAQEQSLQRAFTLYEQAARLEPTAANIRLGLAETALLLGEWAAGDPIRWYMLGEQAAERAITMDATSADAHFLLAAHRGQIADRRRDASGLTVPRELEEHLFRSLALNPRHARALHMMGALLKDTPWYLRLWLKGSEADAEKYLVAAVDADPSFPEARIDLARHYRDKRQTAKARSQAEAVMRMTSPTQRRAWREKHRPAAEALLRELAVK